MFVKALKTVVREDLIENLIFERRAMDSHGVVHVNLWGRRTLPTENSKWIETCRNVSSIFKEVSDARGGWEAEKRQEMRPRVKGFILNKIKSHGKNLIQRIA